MRVRVLPPPTISEVFVIINQPPMLRSAQQFLKPNCQHLRELPLALRNLSSLEPVAKDSDDDDGVNGSEIKPEKRSTKSKMAKSMARLINNNSKPWSIEIESSLSSLSPSLSKTTFFQVLRLIKTPSRALQFFSWAQRIGFTHNNQSYFLMLEILGRSRNLNVARNFLFSIKKRSNGAVKLEDRYFNSLIRSYARAGLFQESVKLFTLMKSIGVYPAVITFNSLFMILLKRGRTNMVRDVFDEMLRTYGVKPDTCTFNILIRGFCKNSMVDESFRLFKEMVGFGCGPDLITYNTLVDGLCREGKVTIAHNLVKGMTRKAVDLNPDVVTYTTLVRGYCMKQEIDEALVLFKEMVDRGLKPNAVTYNTLIKGLCEAQKIDKVKEILEGALGAGGFAPDTCTFNTIINAHCVAGNMSEALKVFENMIEFEVQPDAATYSILIRKLCQNREFEKAEQLFDELFGKEVFLSDKGCKPLVVAYKSMFKFLCGNGKTKRAEEVFRQLLKRGTQDPESFKILIMGHLREGTFEAGYNLLVLMLRRDFVPDFETYQLLIEGFLHQDKPLLAYQSLQKMLKSSYLPKASVFHSILAGLLKKSYVNESASLIVLMLEGKTRQNIHLSTHTIRLLFCSGLKDKAFMIAGLLYDNGYVIGMEEVIGFLCQSRKLVEAHKMLLFCLEEHHKVDIHMYNVVIEGLCKMNKLTEAFELYHELVEKGKHQQLHCLEDLRIALEAGGRSEEAKFVSKRMPN